MLSDERRSLRPSVPNGGGGVAAVWVAAALAFGYALLLALILLVSLPMDRFGTQLGVAGFSVGLPHWSGFLWVAPSILLLLFALAACFDASTWPAMRARRVVALIALLIFAGLALLSSFAIFIGLDSDPALFDGQPSSDSTTRAARWLNYAYVFPGFLYLAHAVFARLADPEKRLSWLRLLLVGAVPTLVLAVLAAGGLFGLAV